MTTWAIVNSDSRPEVHEKLMAISGMVYGRDIPIFHGTLDEFKRRYNKPFTVYPEGFYIKVGTL